LLLENEIKVIKRKKDWFY